MEGEFSSTLSALFGFFTTKRITVIKLKFRKIHSSTEKHTSRIIHYLIRSSVKMDM